MLENNFHNKRNHELVIGEIVPILEHLTPSNQNCPSTEGRIIDTNPLQIVCLSQNCQNTGVMLDVKAK